MDRFGAWPARLTWFVLPLVAGPALGDALDGASRPVQAVGSVGLWGIWAGVLAATLVPRTVTLTALRIAAPAVVAAAVAGAVAGAPAAADAAALTGTVVAVLVAFAPSTGEAFVDGSSYGDERRLPLRVPAPLLAGPIELAWAAVVAGTATGPLLLAAGRWGVGIATLAVGPIVGWWGARVLHSLARRWVVFVPSGLVLHDPLALAEPVLLRRTIVASLGPAPADTAALDLTLGAIGLALEAQLSAPVDVVVRAGRSTREVRKLDAVLFTPTRPGAVLAVARSRRFSPGGRH